MNILERHKEAIAEQEAERQNREQYYEDAARLTASWRGYNPHLSCESPTDGDVQRCLDHGKICCEFVPRDKLLEHIDAILFVLNERCESEADLDTDRHNSMLKLYFDVLRASISGDSESVIEALEAIRVPNAFFRDSFGANWFPDCDYRMDLKNRLFGSLAQCRHPDFGKRREFKAHTAADVRTAFETDFGRKVPQVDLEAVDCSPTESEAAPIDDAPEKTNAQTKRFFPDGLPDDTNLIKLAMLRHDKQNEKFNGMELARDVTGETEISNCPLAISLDKTLRAMKTNKRGKRYTGP